MDNPDRVAITAAEIRAMCDAAAEEGAKKALASLGLQDAQAPDDLRDLRSLLTMMRGVRATLAKRILDGLVTASIGVVAAIVAMGWWGRP